MERSVRLGLVGTGNIGGIYIRMLQEGRVERVQLTAACSRSKAQDFGVPHFDDLDALLSSGLCDALLIATPTMLHPQMWRQAAAKGLHLLVEKPLAMSVAQAQLMLEAPVERSGLSDQRAPKRAVMLNQRFHPHYARIRSLIDADELGSISRVSWTMTAWYRPDIYYQVSSWRGTWPGEGGGLLINQCIHNLDVLQWLVGLPSEVSASAAFGKYHAIDVEDEFTATLTFGSGATGVVVASSGEAPGINQLDIVGDRGTIRFDGEELLLYRADQSVAEHARETSEMFGMPNFDAVCVSTENAGAANQHAHVVQNFVNAILDDEPLLTPAAEGLASLQLANGILLSAWEGKPIELPLDARRYEQELQKRVRQGSLRRPSSRKADIDVEKSFR